MSAIVIFPFEDGPLCSRGSLLVEGSTSLKTLILILSQWNNHPNCSNPMEVLYGPSYSYKGVIFKIPDWSMILNCMILFGLDYILTICRIGMNVIYCGPESSNLKSCSVEMICSLASVVCHGGVCDCILSALNGIVLTCFYSGCAHPIIMIWSGLCVSHDSWSCDVCCI